MARPKKKRHFRPITVNGVDYRWRFYPSAPDSYLKVSRADIYGQPLYLTMKRWMFIDGWLFLGGAYDNIYDQLPWIDNDPISPDYNGLKRVLDIQNNPPSVTNKFVRLVIEHALEKGWQPDTPASDTVFELIWSNGEFVEDDNS